jgi:citrate lyase subunit beta / citryl-CoA lyase
MTARASLATSLDATRPVVVRVNPATRAAALLPVLALIETAVGVQGLAAIAATPGVVRLGICTIDHSLDLGITASDILDPVMLQMVIVSRVAGLAAPVAGATPDFRDLDLIAKEAERSRALGFSAKLCIHPAQLAPVGKSLAPFAAQIAHARRVMEAFAKSGGSAVALDGRMVDRPVIDQARRILADCDGAEHG